jgi:hypothetical protein
MDDRLKVSRSDIALASSPDTRVRALGRYIWPALPLVGVVLLLPRLLSWAQISLGFVTWPWQFDLAEGVNLDATVLLSQGHNIYAPNGPDAFTSAPYTPLFYLLNVPLTWLFGPSFAGGRIISLLATLSVALLLVYVTGKITTSWSAGVFAGALWLSISPVIVWSALYTQSTLALALGFGGLAWTLRCTTPSAGASVRRASASLLPAVVLFALAFYAKQTAVDAAAATILWLIIREPRRGIKVGLAVLALVLIPFGIANIALRGGLWEKVVADHALSWSSGRAWRIGGKLLGEYWPLLVAASIFLVGSAVALARAITSGDRRSNLRTALSSPWALAVYYFLIATASVLARIGGDGINYNHLLDVVAPMCLLAGLSLGWVLGVLQAGASGSRREVKAASGAETSRRNVVVAISGLVACAILVAAQLFEFADPHTWYSGMWPDGPRNGQMQALSNLVAGTRGDVLSDDAYLLLHNGRRDIYDDTFMLISLSALGKWDDSSFVQSIRDRRYSLMFLFGLDRWSPEERQALSDNYSLKFPDILSTYEPLVSPASPQYTLTCSLANQEGAILLKGYSLAPGVSSRGINPGDVLRATLYWQPNAQPGLDYASFVHLVDNKGISVAGQDNPHTGAAGPTTAWGAGRVITDTASLPIPQNVEPGRYRLVAGMYHVEPETGKLQSLPASCRSGEQYGDGVSLGWVDVK